MEIDPRKCRQVRVFLTPHRQILCKSRDQSGDPRLLLAEEEKQIEGGIDVKRAYIHVLQYVLNINGLLFLYVYISGIVSTLDINMHTH